MMHEKIGPHHLDQKAILYVCQSSAIRSSAIRFCTIARAAHFNMPCATV